MNIKFSPQRCNLQIPSVVKKGNTLNISGTVFDIRKIAEEQPDEMPSVWIVNAEIVGGALVATLMLPHSASPPPSVAFPEDAIDVEDGQIIFPS